jgi:hypothetical protein
MDQKPDVIREQIAAQRQDLANNVRELETRVKGMTDWRMHFQRSPASTMGVAAGAGLLLAWLTRGSNPELRNCRCICED